MLVPTRPDRTRPTATKALDPFGYWPERQSALPPLGGPAASPDPHYAFHTPYVAVVPGPARFRVRLRSAGKPGAALSIHLREMRYDDTRSRRISTVTLPLATDEADHSRTISFRACAGCGYALVGRAMEGVPPQTTSLEVELDGWRDDGWYAHEVGRARSTLFGTRPRDPLGGLVSTRARRRGLLDDRPASLDRPSSQMCTAAQFDEPAFGRWLDRLHIPLTRHRKLWEMVWILAMLDSRCLIRAGTRGLGFGCGGELLPSLFAAEGVAVVATDQALAAAAAGGWVQTGQHAHLIDRLRWPSLCGADRFAAQVRLREVDMNAVPDDLTGFDFCWSACALEHLGSLAHGLRFIERSLACLRPGGLAVHTTELNLVSNRATARRGPTVLYRRRDLETLVLRLQRQGHRVMPLRFDSGDHALDAHVDLPPFAVDPHIRLAVDSWAATSFGIAVVRSGG